MCDDGKTKYLIDTCAGISVMKPNVCHFENKKMLTLLKF